MAAELNAVLEGGEEGGVVAGLVCFEFQDQGGAAFSAGVLGEQEDGGLGAFGGGAVAEPGGEGDAGAGCRVDTGKVEDDGAEASCLEEEVGDAEGLFEVGEDAGSGRRPWA